MNSSGQAAATPKKQTTYTVMFEGTALEPMQMVIESAPPPSAPATPAHNRNHTTDARPMLPLRIHLHTPSRTPARTEDEEDVFTAAGPARCEACGAAFASSNRRAFWKHVTLNVCRKRQELRGRGRLGMWWTGRGRL